MDLGETIRLGGRCSVWGCEDPILAEALCSAHHLAFNLPAKPPGPEPTVRHLHKAKRTRRFALGRASARPAKNNQEAAYSPMQKDATVAHFVQELPTPPRHQLPDHRVSNPTPEHPSGPAPENTASSRHNLATAEDSNASTLAAETIPRRPREPYFMLNTDIPSIDKNHSAFPRQQVASGLPESRHVPSKASHQGNSALVDDLVQAGLEFASTLRFSFVPLAKSIHENDPSVLASARVGLSNVEESPSMTAAKTPSRKTLKSLTSHRHDASSIHVYQASGPHLQIMEDIPLHLSPKKRKGDAADVQSSMQEPAQLPRQGSISTRSGQKRQTRSQSSAQLDDGYQTSPSGEAANQQVPRLSNGRATSHPRNTKRARISYEATPMIGMAQAKTKGRLEALSPVQGKAPNGCRGRGSSPISQQIQQPKPRDNGSRDERESQTVPRLSTTERDVAIVEVQNTPITRQSPAQDPKAKGRFFDSEAFDAMVYQQSSLRPPPGVSGQAAARLKPPGQKPLIRDQRQYLAVNPAIHMLHNRSDDWYKRKALEIQGRGGRKAWFGKVIERRRWIRAKERAEEEVQNAAKASYKEQKQRRVDPKPWSYDRIMDFGDVPEEALPGDVLQNPAWVKACAWHRENEAKRALRDRAAEEAHREAWAYAESIMKDATLASEYSRRSSKQ